MKLNTADLDGIALRYAVAVLERAGICSSTDGTLRDMLGRVWAPDTDWAQGGPIIEREGISVSRRRGDNVDLGWSAYLPSNDQIGRTALIAAMRCFIASREGCTVDVPEGLFL